MRWLPLTFIVFSILGSPLTLALETGDNDFRISDAGGSGDAAYSAQYPDVAYNPHRHEYLVAWHADDPIGGQVEGKLEIFVQRIDAATGREVGVNDRRITATGDFGDSEDGALEPRVAYNPHAREYLVVWRTELNDDQYGLFGQRLDGASGAPRGEIGFLIALSDSAYALDMVYNPTQREYLVAWQSTPPELGGGSEIFVRRLDGQTGQLLGTTAERISAMRDIDAEAGYAVSPAIAVDTLRNRYLVAWAGRALGVDNVYGQLVDGVTGLEVGLDDVQISAAGAEGGSRARDPSVIYQPDAGDEGAYMVVFSKIPFGRVTRDQIFGQLVEPVLGLTASRFDVSISAVGRIGAQPEVGFPTLAPTPRGALVIWQGEDPNLASHEAEIFGRFVNLDLAVESSVKRLSDMGVTDDSKYIPRRPVVAAAGEHDFLVVWESDDASPMVFREYEIFGQLLTTRLLIDSFEAGNVGAWSSVRR